MAFTRKFLAGLGIEDDKVEQIINTHREVVDALKDERDQYKEDAEKLPNVQKELDDRKKAEKESDDKDKWKVKYDALKEEYDKYKTGVDEKELERKKKAAFSDLLKSAGVSEKRIPAILRVTDFSQIELDEEGKLKDEAKAKAEVKTEWADFIGKEHTEGASTDTPPNGNGSGEHKPSKAAQIAVKQYERLYGTKVEETK